MARFPVQSVHVLTFARAIGDENPVFRDRAVARASGLADIAAPLTFVQASAHVDPDYTLRPQPGEEWTGSGSGPGVPDPRTADLLHAEQSFEYHRPVVVGDELTVCVIDGESWTKQGRLGGTLRFHTRITQYRDQDGDLVVTARSVRVQTANRPVLA